MGVSMQGKSVPKICFMTQNNAKFRAIMQNYIPNTSVAYVCWTYVGQMKHFIVTTLGDNVGTMCKYKVALPLANMFELRHCINIAFPKLGRQSV